MLNNASNNDKVASILAKSFEARHRLYFFHISMNCIVK
jgi:hypothetical protein